MGEQREPSNGVSERLEKKNRKSSKNRAKESESDAARDERKRAKKEKRRKKENVKESEQTDVKKLESAELLSESTKTKTEKKRKVQDTTDAQGTELQVSEGRKLKTKGKKKNLQDNIADDKRDGNETIHLAKTHNKEEEAEKGNEDLKDSNSCIEEEEKETSKRGKKRPCSNDDDGDETEKSTKSKKRKGRLDERKQLREQVPKVDENGISYTKQQIRRMMRRVKKGLSAVPTPEEEAEIKRQDALLRKEEEKLYAGLPEEPQDKENGESDPHDEDEDDDDEEENDTSNLDSKKNTLEENKPSSQQDECTVKPVDVSPTKIFKIKTKKPVPPDYVCQACQNSLNVPPHWIYDCPNKVTVRKGNKSNQEPSAKKVFVSGLFFDTRLTDVKQMFSACGKIVSCKILKFQDTKRCKGQAYVSFDTEEAAQKAIKMSGTMIASEKNGNKKELKLQVSRVLNRSLTGNKKRKN